MSLEEHKRRERAQAIGLFRYQLICPALDAGLSTKQRGKLVRQIAAGTHTDPFGNQVRVSRETLDRWIRRYRGGGFEALLPEPRRLAARTDAQVLELAASLKRENPTRTATQVARILRTATGWAPSESTLLRLFHRLELMGRGAGEAPAVFGRFEAANPNELWVGDALHGPRVGDRKTYLFAFLDDHSRFSELNLACSTWGFGHCAPYFSGSTGVPSSTVVAVRLWIWASLSSAPARLTRRPSASPSQPSRSASAIRSVRFSRISSSRSCCAGSGQSNAQRTQACSWTQGVPNARPQVPMETLRRSK